VASHPKREYFKRELERDRPMGDAAIGLFNLHLTRSWFCRDWLVALMLAHRCGKTPGSEETATKSITGRVRWRVAFDNGKAGRDCYVIGRAAPLRLPKVEPREPKTHPCKKQPRKDGAPFAFFQLRETDSDNAFWSTATEISSAHFSLGQLPPFVRPSSPVT
jgi:hypothetical protein